MGSPDGNAEKARDRVEDLGADFQDTFGLRIRGAAGHSKTYEVGPSDTVAQLKACIEFHTGTPCKDQRLISNSVVMIDDRTLGSYKLCEGSVVLLMPLLKAVSQAGRDKARGSPRGILMVPGMNTKWMPQNEYLTARDLEGFFDSYKDDHSALMNPWKNMAPPGPIGLSPTSSPRKALSATARLALMA
eukprot:gnl/TRDRNA2_/TRDRNA2_196295_c0_seq1.p1 gnl/TRDRNA2_/TRDRNA2_196295_c0~~gnl/TRDRNA2_/TRDRNA2_196295_c0_seq1.p1  ORF type:complete len:188 (-),score=29.81 gnl/TRDRNA2_/TRDRNA2_196295_c0_seq1:82-645(-)